MSRMRRDYNMKRILLITKRIREKFIYKEHVGLIFSLPVGEMINTPVKKKVQVKRCYDALKINEFYTSAGRKMPLQQAKGWLLKGHECWVASEDSDGINDIIGATWLFFGVVEINGLHGRVFSKNLKVNFSSHTGYCALTIVNDKYRGLGIQPQIHQAIADFHLKNAKRIKKIVVTMGANNESNIKSWLKMGACLIAVVEVKYITGLVFINNIFINKDEICWR